MNITTKFDIDDGNAVSAWLQPAIWPLSSDLEAHT